MNAVRNTVAVLVLGLGAAGWFLFQESPRYHNPYPPFSASLKSAETDLQDVGGVVLGLRRLAADMAWVQTLQYYGTAEAGHDDAIDETGPTSYPHFLSYCQRVARIDPYFTYVYYFGGSVLTWNLNRLPEGEELLKEGIAANPTEWRLSQYLAGIAYQRNHDVANLMRFLESVASDPQCPLLMKAILANLYKKEHLYGKAIALWQTLYLTGDPVYQSRAIDQFQAIRKLQKASGS